MSSSLTDEHVHHSTIPHLVQSFSYQLCASKLVPFHHASINSFSSLATTTSTSIVDKPSKIISAQQHQTSSTPSSSLQLFKSPVPLYPLSHCEAELSLPSPSTITPLPQQKLPSPQMLLPISFLVKPAPINKRDNYTVEDSFSLLTPEEGSDTPFKQAKRTVAHNPNPSLVAKSLKGLIGAASSQIKSALLFDAKHLTSGSQTQEVTVLAVVQQNDIFDLVASATAFSPAKPIHLPPLSSSSSLQTSNYFDASSTTSTEASPFTAHRQQQPQQQIKFADVASQVEQNNRRRQIIAEEPMNEVVPKERFAQAVRLEDITPFGEQYFVPSLLRSFESTSDKQSQLFSQYFQKIFQHYGRQSKGILETIRRLKKPPIVYLPRLEDPKRKTIFFDLDETLIHCVQITQSKTPNPDDKDAIALIRKGATADDNSSQDNISNVTVCTIEYPQGFVHCHVAIRPYAREILQELSKDFELILLTASKQMYADSVLEKLDPTGELFSHRFYRECCSEIYMSHIGENFQQLDSKTYLKDLRIFANRSPENILLVDNSPLAFLQQISNGVPILDFCNDNPQDTELVKLTGFLQSLLPVQDVRNVIRKKFKLKKYKTFARIESLRSQLIAEYHIDNQSN